MAEDASEGSVLAAGAESSQGLPADSGAVRDPLPFSRPLILQRKPAERKRQLYTPTQADEWRGELAVAVNYHSERPDGSRGCLVFTWGEKN